MPPLRAKKDVSNVEEKEAFRMNNYTRKNMKNRKRRIERRLSDRNWTDQAAPMFSASNIQYEMGERTRGTSVGGYRDDAFGGAADRADRSHRQGRACAEAATCRITNRITC